MSVMLFSNIVPFSARLKMVRAVRGLSQVFVAEETGIDRSLISRYESGLNPPAHQVKALEEFFGLKFDGPEVEKAIQLIIDN